MKFSLFGVFTTVPSQNGEIDEPEVINGTATGAVVDTNVPSEFLPIGSPEETHLISRHKEKG
jgi:hypothetical protein